MTSLMVIGTALCASIAVTSFSNYNRKSYKEICEEEYPVLFEEQYSRKLSAVSLKSTEGKFVVSDEKQHILYEIIKNPAKEYSWFVNKDEENLWEILISKKNISFFGSKAKVSYAFSNQEGSGKPLSIQYCYSNLHHNSFSLFDTKKTIGEPYVKNDIEFRWLFESKYLEKIIKSKNGYSLKRIAFAVNKGKDDQKNDFNDYQIIYNKNEIDQESLIITLFISTMTQWKHHDICSEILKDRIIKWNEIRSNYYRDEETRKEQENIKNKTDEDKLAKLDESSDLTTENKKKILNTNTKYNKSALSDVSNLPQKLILGNDPRKTKKQDPSSIIDKTSIEKLNRGDQKLLKNHDCITQKTSFRRKLFTKTWNKIRNNNEL